jgi:hypothetical protein
LIERLALDLTQQFGRGFSACNLDQMRQFFLTWAIPQTVSAELPKLLFNEKKAQTPSAKSKTPFRQLSLSELAQAFTLHRAQI